MTSPISAEEIPYVIEKESQYFTVGYAVSENSGASHWMLWNSENMGKAADVPSDDPLILERFKNAVDTCIIYETKVKQGILTILAGYLSPIIWAVTVPDIIESWSLAENSAANADYYFSLIQ